MSLPNQIDQADQESLLMHPMLLEVNQILPLHQIDLVQLKVINQALQALNHKLLEVQGHQNLDLVLGVLLEVVGLVRVVPDLGRAAPNLVPKALNPGRKAQNLDLRAQSLDHRVQSRDHKALNLVLNHIPQNPKGQKADPDHVVEALRIVNRGQDLGVLLQNPKVQLQDRMLTVGLIHQI